MCKDCHLARVSSGVQHDVHGEALTRQVAFALRVGQCITVEAQRCGRRYVVAQQRTQHFEVVDVAQVVASYWLRELDEDVVADAQDAVGRLRRSEGYGTAGILDALQHLRRTRQVATGMAAVGHGTDVVILLYGIHLAIERCHDDARGRNGVGDTAGLLLQFLVGIV